MLEVSGNLGSTRRAVPSSQPENEAFAQLTAAGYAGTCRAMLPDAYAFILSKRHERKPADSRGTDKPQKRRAGSGQFGAVVSSIPCAHAGRSRCTHIPSGRHGGMAWNP